MEIAPERFYAINGGKVPMGVHQYRQYSPYFWSKVIGSPSQDNEVELVKTDLNN
jgi:hypothetical protein